jgi:hypothetical protein
VRIRRGGSSVKVDGDMVRSLSEFGVVSSRGHLLTAGGTGQNIFRQYSEIKEILE